MAWIGISDRFGGRFAARGLTCRTDSEPAIASDTLMPRGTLLLETRLSAEGRPQTLLGFNRSHPWPGSFTLQSLPGGGIVLVEAQGDDLRHVTLPIGADGRMDVLRLSYAWDAPARWAQLSVERTERDTPTLVAPHAPHPLLLSDAQGVTTDARRRVVDADVTFFALSNTVEPIGPMPGLTGEVPIATPGGEVPVRRLKRGDLIMTQDGKVVPVLQVVKRVVPAKGNLRPVHLRAPYFGLRRDILVAPQQRLVIGGSEVEYLFGREAVLVPARHLVNGVSALRGEGPDLVTYHHLLLPGHEVIMAAGCPLESLYLGRLRRKPELLSRSVLAGFDRARLPEHAKPAWPVLKPFEAITLAMNRAA
ncbi:Hint domain-containing protein [Roseovarius sp. MMSF_3281]|uniref:Hint domain-containing protein n=1 Tax=Roseovarius sp. MMSF_3281 TaxID=3046694 RepID=UPI00273E4270|nr:Hint domain-containing protein [Roseovarius sp. MMSF_3281]